MHFVQVSSVACLVLALYVAASHASFFSFRRWTFHAWFSLICLSAAGSSLSTTALAMGIAATWVPFWTRVMFVCGVVHVVAWLRYADSELAPLPRRWERLLVGSLLTATALYLIPGLGLRGVVQKIELPGMGIVYQLPESTVLGFSASAVQQAGLLLTVMRYVQGVRQRLPFAALHLVGLAVMLAAAFNDSMVLLQGTPLPFLVPSAYCVLIGIIGASMSRRWAEDVRRLDELSNRLERLVERRTNDLMEAQLALLRSEKLAAIGNLAGAVAHDINNPVGAARGNVKYLADALERDRTLPEDALDALGDTGLALDRISRIVCHLLDSSRLARAGHGSTRIDVRETLQQGIANATEAAIGDVPVKIEVPEALQAWGDLELLQSTITNLVLNGARAVQAGRSGGSVMVTARREEGSVLITVRDNGVGLGSGHRSYVTDPAAAAAPTAPPTAIALDQQWTELRAGAFTVESNARGTTVTITLAAEAGQASSHAA